MNVQADRWLSAALGYPVFRLEIDPASAGEVAALPRPADGPRAMYYAKVPTDQVELVGRLTAVGFQVIDVGVAFSCTPRGPRPDAGAVRPWTIREIERVDHDAVLDIAASCFRYSRFHLDPAISMGAANQLKREWVLSYIRKERGERLYVAHDSHERVGFLAVLAPAGDQPRRVIDLIGVHPGHQRRGVGEALVRFFLDVHGDGATRLEVGTQVANIPSIRLYEKLGFSVVQSQYVLHMHVGDRRDGAA